MKRREAIDTLKATGWLSRQPETFQSDLLQNAELRSYANGSTIQVAGDGSNGLYGVASGELSVLIAPEEIPPCLVQVAQPGWWFGDVALLSEGRRVVTLVARSAVEILAVDRFTIVKLVESDSTAWRRIAEITVMHLVEALRIISALSSASPDVRLGLALARLIAPNRASPNEPVTVRVTQSELGEMTGTTRNAIKPILLRMQTEGIVSWRYKTITIASEDALWAYVRRRA